MQILVVPFFIMGAIVSGYWWLRQIYSRPKASKICVYLGANSLKKSGAFLLSTALCGIFFIRQGGIFIYASIPITIFIILISHRLTQPIIQSTDGKIIILVDPLKTKRVIYRTQLVSISIDTLDHGNHLITFECQDTKSIHHKTGYNDQEVISDIQHFSLANGIPFHESSQSIRQAKV